MGGRMSVTLRQGFGREEFNQMLVDAAASGVSDISIQTGGQAIFHLHGEHIPVTDRPILHYEMSALVTMIYGGDNAISMLAGGRDLDPRYEFTVSRGKKLGFRVNITQCRTNGNDNGYAITLRALPSKPRTLSELKRPAEISSALFQDQGLIVVAGATGSGKSTLLAGAISHTLEHDRDNKILTYERPIEYTYELVPSHPSNIIFQHEIGVHLKSFSDGVRNALRRAPTAILVGESRDQETIDATIEATLTGHTTYTTVHAETVGGVVSRMIQAFPYEAHSSIAEKLLASLRLIVVQRLARNATGDGRVALNEWLPLGKDEKRALAACRADQLAAAVDAMVLERKTSMAHHAAFEYGRGNLTLEAASAASGVAPAQIELLAGKLDESLYLPGKG